MCDCRGDAQVHVTHNKRAAIKLLAVTLAGLVSGSIFEQLLAKLFGSLDYSTSAGGATGR